MWNNEWKVSLLSMSNYHVDVEIIDHKGLIGDSQGLSVRKMDYKSWPLLKSLENRSSLPRVYAGSYNDVCKAEGEKTKTGKTDVLV